MHSKDLKSCKKKQKYYNGLTQSNNNVLKIFGKEPIFKKKGTTYGMWKKVCLVTLCISQKNLL